MASLPAKLPRKPNLTVFLPDQQRPDTIACYGNGKVHSPNLGKFASESVVFSRAYVTHPVCTPSRSSLMTGMWPHTNGCTRNSVPLGPQFQALPQLLQNKDYHTAYIGKWHLGDEARNCPRSPNPFGHPSAFEWSCYSSDLGVRCDDLVSKTFSFRSHTQDGG
jgi:arylsulfatase A-like enzyme